MEHRRLLVWGGLTLCLLLLAPLTVLAQRVVDIPQGVGTINSVIEGDTVAGGARVDDATVYHLQRGGIYLLDGTLDHSYPINIEAAPGAGAKPYIYQSVPSGGTAPDQPWAPRANLYFKNIRISAIDELQGGHTRIFRIRENDVRVVIDSCELDMATQAAVRVDGVNTKIYITNTVISNIGTGDSPDNGRGIDDRGNDIDSLIIENSTCYNLTSRVIRDAGGITNYCKVNHCTMYNIGQWGVSFGECGVAIFTNNLLVNGGYYGNSDNTTSFKELVQLLPPSIGSLTADIRNNDIYDDAALVSAFPDTVSVPPTFDSTWNAVLTNLGTGSTITSEVINFVNAPNAPIDVVIDWYTDPAPPNPDLDTTGGPFDFSYPTNQSAYTGGSDGKPLGDLNWFNIPLLGVKPIGNAVPATFRLYENYPNPFNPSTHIQFDITQHTSAVLEVFNALGQKVATLVNGNLEPGSYSVDWNGTADDGARVASGIYLYRLQTDGLVATRKMVLLK